MSILSRLHVTQSECWVFLWNLRQHRQAWDTAKKVDFEAGLSCFARQWAWYRICTLLQLPCGSSLRASRLGLKLKPTWVVAPINLMSISLCKSSCLKPSSLSWALAFDRILRWQCSSIYHHKFDSFKDWMKYKGSPFSCAQPRHAVDMGSAAVQ